MSFHLSKIALGFWRAVKWGYSANELNNLITQSLEMGITTFDHADIYGDYECESLFGNVLKVNPSLRTKMQIVTKCGIKLLSPKFPERKVKIYDTSKDHIISSVDRSLLNFGTDYIDVLLIHRPDPFINADEVASAFNDLMNSGKVLNFGVSNFLPSQFQLLQSRLSFPLVTNQIEVSVLNHEHFENGNIDFLQEKRVAPMVWSPLAGGRIYFEQGEKANRVRNVLYELKDKYGTNDIDSIALAWLFAHPVNFIVVLGSGKIERIKSAMQGLKINLQREDWFRILLAGRETDLP